MTKFTLDGVEFNSEAEVVSALTTLKSQLDSSQQETSHFQEHLDAMTALRDAAVEEVTSTKAKLDEALASVPAQLDAAVASRLALINAAVSAGITLKGDESELAIRSAVILAASPKADLADKGEAYILARFDAAVEALATGAAQSKENREKVADLHTDTAAPAEGSAEAKRLVYLDSLTNGWKAGNK